jgi:hypothetical protein
MHVDITFGMPLGFLTNADERLKFGKDLINHAEIVKPSQSDRGLLRSQEKLLELAPDPLFWKIGDVDRLADRDGLRRDIEFHSRCKLRRTQHAERVFGKSFRREVSQDFLIDIFPAVKRIDDLVRQRIFQNGVDRKVTARASFLERHIGIALDNKSSVTLADLSLASRDRNIEIVSQLINRKRLSDDVDFTKGIEDVRRRLGSMP